MSTSTNSAWLQDFDPDEVRAVWNGLLRKVSGTLPPAMSAPSRSFLADVGLPDDPGLPDMIFRHHAGPEAIVQSGGRDRMIITETTSPIGLAIDLASDGVYEFNGRDSWPDRLFNSNIAALVYFVGVLNREVLTLSDYSEEVIVPAVARVWGELLRRDGAAMEGHSPWKAWLDDLGSQYE